MSFVIQAEDVPVLDGALDYVKAMQIPGGLGRNREDLLMKVEAGTALAVVQAEEPIELLTLLFDAQTSGALLAAVLADRVAAVRSALEDQGVISWEIGEVHPGRGTISL